eukprot:2853363-Prymnesium_polylepis.1
MIAATARCVAAAHAVPPSRARSCRRARLGSIVVHVPSHPRRPPPLSRDPANSNGHSNGRSRRHRLPL